jgi:hypothetical protein
MISAFIGFIVLTHIPFYTNYILIFLQLHLVSQELFSFQDSRPDFSVAAFILTVNV